MAVRINTNKLKYDPTWGEDRYELQPRNYFWASELDRPLFELYCRLNVVEKTNPPTWEETLKWGAGNGVEEAMVNILKMNGVVEPDYDQKEHGRVDMVWDGVRITGYTDVKTKDGTPIEVKSVNNANYYYVKELEAGEPRISHVVQLIAYMRNAGKDRGILFVSTIDGQNTFVFYCDQIDEYRYKCGNVEVDMREILERLQRVQNELLEIPSPAELPEDVIYEKRYKIPVEEVDWKEVSKSKRTAARAGRRVVGDWELKYSDYKDLWVGLQGDDLGYTKDEINKIKELTKGHTTW